MFLIFRRTLVAVVETGPIATARRCRCRPATSTPKLRRHHRIAANELELPLHKAKEPYRELAKIAVARFHHPRNEVFNELFTINTGKLEQKGVVSHSLSPIEPSIRIAVQLIVSAVVLDFKVVVIQNGIVPVAVNAAADGRPQTEPRFTQLTRHYIIQRLTLYV